ncbi:unnamed protein product [Mucor hiemalis]
MTAEQPSPSHLFPITAMSTTQGDTNSNKLLQNNDLLYKELESKKRKRLLLEEEEEEAVRSILPPIEKSPRRNDYQVTIQQEEEQGILIDVSKLNQTEKLMAYRRIWDNLDLSKPADAKLEPFVWQKIREYQRNK